MPKRIPIPSTTRSAVLIANRHACCVCQKPRVQLHHIDGDNSNNVATNLAALCVDHHDQATMMIGLTAKLKPAEVRHYKEAWEQRCANDQLALTRDRLNYYMTLYKNPPRIREAFLRLNDETREAAVRRLMEVIDADEAGKETDKGFDWQTSPRRDKLTYHLLAAAMHGETWPSCLYRVGGHEEDPDLPVNLAPPHGMTAFHGFDSYCQIMVQILALANPPIALDALYELSDFKRINDFAGSLVTFREDAIGIGVRSPRAWREAPTSRVELVHRRNRRQFRTAMQLKNMYVFSDTSAENLAACRVCGIGILGGATKLDNGDIQIQVVPLLIGMGGFGQADPSGWGWKPEFSPKP